MFRKKDYFVKYESWTTILTCNPFITPLTELLAKTPVTPNQITVLSFLVALSGVYLYFTGKLMAGALVWHVGFILDCVDGSLARKLGKTSEFGAKLDHNLDKIKKILAIIAIIYVTHSQYNLSLMILLVILHYLLHRIKFRNNEVLMEYLHARGIKSFFDPLDEQFFIVFLGPLTGYVFQFVVITLLLQILNRVVHLCYNKYGFGREQSTQF